VVSGVDSKSVNPGPDIVFDRDNWRFNHRIVGMALDRGRVLLQQVEGKEWWAMPGGRGTFGEPARECLKREMKEELDADAEIGRLVWVVENFFRMDSRDYHELSLFFLIKFATGSPVLAVDEVTGLDHEASGEMVRVIYRWHRLDDLEKVALFPAFLRTGLQKIPPATEYVVHVDE
jgi:ADP-ribose pyrophosphatase YjhB (NUDIX family)